MNTIHWWSWTSCFTGNCLQPKINGVRIRSPIIMYLKYKVYNIYVARAQAMPWDHKSSRKSSGGRKHSRQYTLNVLRCVLNTFSIRVYRFHEVYCIARHKFWLNERWELFFATNRLFWLHYTTLYVYN